MSWHLPRPFCPEPCHVINHLPMSFCLLVTCNARCTVPQCKYAGFQFATMCHPPSPMMAPSCGRGGSEASTGQRSEDEEKSGAGQLLAESATRNPVCAQARCRAHRIQPTLSPASVVRPRGVAGDHGGVQAVLEPGRLSADCLGGRADVGVGSVEAGGRRRRR